MKESTLIMGGLFALIILVVLFRRRQKARRCKWRRSKTGSRGSLIKYHCTSCGSEAYSGKGKPERCMAAFKTPGL